MSAAAARAAPKKRLSAADRRAQILQVAREVFVAAGYAGTRIQDIGRAADVNDALLYRHFDSKEALFEAAVAEPLQAGVERLLTLGETAREQLASEETMRAYAYQLLGELLSTIAELAPLLGIVLFADPVRSASFYEGVLTPAVDRLAAAIDEHDDEWEHREFSSRQMLLTAIGACLMLALDERLGGRSPGDRDRAIKELADQLLNAVRKDAE